MLDEMHHRLRTPELQAHGLRMFMVDEEDIAAIQEAYAQGGEFAAAIELRRRFPGIQDNAEARQCARSIASWQPLPESVKLKPPRRKGRSVGQ